MNSVMFPIILILLNIVVQVKSQLSDDPGVPLLLTPLIESGKIQDALDASQIYFNGFKGVKSYSGYFTVNKNSNLFFWFFPSQNNYDKAPVVLWLQGGPGSSSLIGLFAENGPFKVKSKKGLELRKFTWIQTYSVIYIDNPVGSGFSFTDDDGNYCTNQTQIATDLYNALVQFFLMFPELSSNEFYVTGESYAGKYIPAFAYTITTTKDNKINFKGLAIGNGLSDPLNQLKYGDYLFQIGLIDSHGRTQIQTVQDKIIKSVHSKNWSQAYELFNNLILDKRSLITNLTGFAYHFNYLFTTDPSNELDYIQNYLSRNDVRAAIHVGNVTFSDGSRVLSNLREDFMQSVTPWLVQLLNDNYKVLIYNGQLDIIVAYPLTVNYLQNLNFSYCDQYKSAIRYQWYVDGTLAGYVKQAGNLTEVLVRNSGHLVPQDQPQWGYDMISRFISGKPFH